MEYLKVSRRSRMLIAGMAWCGVGIMLFVRGVGWLQHAPMVSIVLFGGGGLAIGLVAWRSLFRSIAVKNVTRLASSAERALVLDFQPLKSWLIMTVMIALGVTLRHSAVPKIDLAPVYVAVGAALFLSSLLYFTHLLGVPVRSTRA